MAGRDSDGLDGLDVVILAGGLGTRISAVLKDTPKLLAPVSGRPLLEYLIDWLLPYNPGRLVLCLGHLADRVEAYLEAHPPRLPVVTSIEPTPLGTGGALVLAREQLQSNPVMVMNGDSFVDADLGAFARRHSAAGVGASMLCVRVPDTARFGRIKLDDHDRIVRFIEKGSDQKGEGLINGGVYLFERSFIDGMEDDLPLSLENDIFSAAPRGQIYAVHGDYGFIDIGTPESLAAATAAMLEHSGRQADGEGEA